MFLDKAAKSVGCAERLCGQTRGKQNPVDLRKDTEMKEKWHYERMQVLKTMTATKCRCNADDVMMECNKQIN